MANQTIFNAKLRLLPTHFKLLFSAVLLTLATGYVFALTNLALNVGMSSAKIIEHYWGNEATQEQLKKDAEAEKAKQKAAEAPPAAADSAAPAAAAPAAAEEEMSFDEVAKEEPKEQVVSVPNFSTLVAEGHFHLFGYTFLFFLCALIISFAELNPVFRNTLIIAPFVASVFDIWSILLTRFVGPFFSWVLIASGTAMGLSFGLVFFIGMYQMWLMKAPKGEVDT